MPLFSSWRQQQRPIISCGNGQELNSATQASEFYHRTPADPLTMENPGAHRQLTDTKYTAVIKTGPHTTRSMPKSQQSSVVTRLSTRPRNRARVTNSDAVALSSPALDLQMLKTAIDQLPEINAARVVDLHHRIIASEYKIDARQLAKKMLDLEKSLDMP